MRPTSSPRGVRSTKRSWRGCWNRGWPTAVTAHGKKSKLERHPGPRGHRPATTDTAVSSIRSGFASSRPCLPRRSFECWSPTRRSSSMTWFAARSASPPSTPRQIVLYSALKQLGIGAGRTPRFGHLPTVLGEGNRRLSKRDKESGLAEYRTQGYLPEALLNYLALLGWALADDRDIFTMEEMVPAFDIRRVNASPARLDPRK